MMKISLEYRDGIAILSLKGRLDAEGAREFEQFLNTHLQQSERTPVIGMDDVEYLSSAGIRILLDLEKKMKAKNGRILISGIQPYPLSVLKMTGFSTLFAIHPGIDDALSAARSIMGEEKVMDPDTVRIQCRGAQYVISCTDHEPSLLMITGSPGTWQKHPVDHGMTVSVSASPGACSLGWGAPGQSAGVMGHLLTIGTVAAWLPPGGHESPDYLLLDDRTATIPVASSFLISSPGPAHLTGRMQSESGGGISISDMFDALSEIAGRLDFGYRGLFILSFSAEAVSVDLYAHDSTEKFQDLHEKASGGALLAGCAVIVDQKIFPIHFSAADAEALFHHPHDHPFAVPRIMSLFFPGIPFVDDQFPQDAIQDGLASGRPAFGGYLDPRTQVCKAAFSVSVISDILHSAETEIVIDGEVTGLNLDYERIVRMLHPDCSMVLLSPITGGFSGSLVFRDDPVDRHGRREMTFVLKLDRWQNISAEIEGYTGHVQRYIQNNATQIIQHEKSGNFGGILYTFVGIKGPKSRIFSMEEFYLTHTADEVVRVIDRLFRKVLRAWYGQPLLRDLSLYEMYSDPFAYNQARNWAVSRYGISTGDEYIDLPYGLGRSINPLYFMENTIPDNKDEKWNVYLGSVHGDLNMKNVLMDEEENLWLIDFAMTGHSHILRDIAKLETVLKTEMIEMESTDRLLQLLELEKLFLHPGRLSDIPLVPATIDDPDIEKAYTVISQLRRYADRVTVLDDDISQYYLALFYYTISIPAFVSVSDHVREYAWITASLLCNRIREVQTVH